MTLSRIAQEFAAEIRQHDWSDAPWRLDRAGHDRSTDTNRGDKTLSDEETAAVRTNAMWVVAQVLGHADPNFDVYEFAEACGVNTLTRSGRRNGFIEAGLRRDWSTPGQPLCHPGTREVVTGQQTRASSPAK
jgi:hypothetical protein